MVIAKRLNYLKEKAINSIAMQNFYYNFLAYSVLKYIFVYRRNIIEDKEKYYNVSSCPGTTITELFCSWVFQVSCRFHSLLISQKLNF